MVACATMKLLLLFLSSILLASCATPGGGDPTAKLPKPPGTTGKRIFLKGTPEWKTPADAKADLGSNATVSGNTVDLKGNTLDGSKLKHPSNPNDENSVGLTIRSPKLVLTNGTVSDIPGGLIVKTKDVTLRRLVFIKPGEDFASTVGETASGLSVEDCVFHNTSSGDKSLQANCAVGLEVDGSEFIGGITGARVQKTSYSQKGVKAVFSDSKFTGNRTGLNVAGDTTVTLKKVSFDGVGQKWVLSGDKAKVVGK